MKQYENKLYENIHREHYTKHSMNLYENPNKLCKTPTFDCEQKFRI